MISKSFGSDEGMPNPSDDELELQDLRISKEKLERMVESRELGSKVIKGYNLLLDGELEESLEIFDEVLENDKQMLVAWYGKGLVSLMNDDLDGAIQFFEKAISLKPDFKDALYEKGVALHKKGRTKEAVEYWKRSRDEEKSY